MLKGLDFGKWEQTMEYSNACIFGIWLLQVGWYGYSQVEKKFTWTIKMKILKKWVSTPTDWMNDPGVQTKSILSPQVLFIFRVDLSSHKEVI